MKDPRALVGLLNPEDIREIRGAGRKGPLSPAALKALDKAAGGPGMGHGYYVSDGAVNEGGSPEFVLHPAAAEEIFRGTE